MKTNMTVSVDKNLKQKVQMLAKKSGTNVSTLVNMYFAHMVNTGQCHFVLDADAGWKSLRMEQSMSFDDFSQMLDDGR